MLQNNLLVLRSREKGMRLMLLRSGTMRRAQLLALAVAGAVVPALPPLPAGVPASLS